MTPKASRLQISVPPCFSCIAIISFFCVTAFDSAKARSWEALYAFGDSYTDGGAGYVDGNGPTAVVYLAHNLEIPFTYAGDKNASGKSLNFAVSGAKTGDGNGVYIRPVTARCGVSEALLGRGVMAQTRDFAQRVAAGRLRFDPERTLFFLAAGLNDGGLPTDTTLANLAADVRTLYEAGARYILLAELPTKIPRFSAVGERLNPGLVPLVAELQKSLPQARIRLSKWGEYFDEVLENPGKYGFANTTNACAGRALYGEDDTPCKSPDSYFYYHDAHPSTAVHYLVGEALTHEVQRAFR